MTINELTVQDILNWSRLQEELGAYWTKSVVDAMDICACCKMAYPTCRNENIPKEG